MEHPKVSSLTLDYMPMKIFTLVQVILSRIYLVSLPCTKTVAFGLINLLLWKDLEKLHYIIVHY
jgi:hypothetical protein